MKLYENELYKEDLNYIASLPLPWELLKNSSILITGATGQIGSMFIDVIMNKNNTNSLNCKIIALSRNEEKIINRFSEYNNNPYFSYICSDVNFPINISNQKIDYIIHLASNTHPLLYSNEPISTITTNIIGLKNLLDFGVISEAKRCIFCSSNEIYGENRGDTETFSEDYCGYINCNTLRAAYTESKRCGEALCQAYIKEKNLDIVIPRITRTYGPTLLNTDSKALSQFIKKAMSNENIVLKSDGKQFYSYLYITDTVSGLFTILLKGQTGEAYNISDAKSNITLKELAEYIAKLRNSKVIFEIPDKNESLGYSKVTKALLNNCKLKQIGWNAKYDIYTGIERTLQILESIQ